MSNHLPSVVALNTNWVVGKLYDVQIYYPEHKASAEIPDDKDVDAYFVDHPQLELQLDSELSVSFKCTLPNAGSKFITITKNLISKVEMCQK